MAHQILKRHGWKIHPRSDSSGGKVEYYHPKHFSHSIIVDSKSGRWDHSAMWSPDLGSGQDKKSISKHLEKFHASQHNESDSQPLEPEPLPYGHISEDRAREIIYEKYGN